MNAAAFLAAFPETERDFCTGGNCTAWKVDCGNGFIALITDGEGDAQQPDVDTRDVFVCIEDADGQVDFEDGSGPVDWKVAIDLVTSAARGAFL